MAQVGLRIGFRGRTERAREFAESHAAALVTRVGREARMAIRNLVVRSIREGVAPRDLARQIRQLVGLSAPQAAAAAAYRRSLIAIGTAPSRVDMLMETYVARKRRERALVIARTELMTSLNQGRLQVAREGVADGSLIDAEKTWIVTPDERLCPLCAPMDHKTVKLDAKFRTPVGPMDGPPMHPNCRCTVAVTSRG